MSVSYLLKIRSYPPETRFASVWLIRRDGDVDSGILWGELIPAAAEELASNLGLPVERDRCPFEGVKPAELPGIPTVEQQRELFS